MMRFQDRDGWILWNIFLYGGMLAFRHLTQMFWPKKTDRAALKRLSKLVEAGYLVRPSLQQRRTQPIPEPIYWLGWRGILWVAAKLEVYIDPPANEGENQMRILARELRTRGIHWLREPRWLQIAHDMAIVDVRLAVERAVDDLPYLQLEEWRYESEFRADGDAIRYAFRDAEGRTIQGEKRVYPDSYFVILDQQRLQEGVLARARLLLELDNATHANARFGREKVAPGAAYIASPRYKERFGDNSGRWLVVTTGHTRMAHLMRQTRQVAGPDAALFHFSTLEEVLASNVLTDPIWRQVGRKKPAGLFGPR
ncbi:MAG: replication-relaxation family protein [Anaerolineae bacterium]|nr:replication-relaxation family protein [Anaerolineae bacterium]